MQRWQEHPNQLIRLDGSHAPAAVVMMHALAAQAWPVQPLPGQYPGHADDVHIDPTLPLAEADQSTPPVGMGYAGLTAAQRGALYDWLFDPTQPGSLAFQRIYLCYLEVALWESERAADARAEISRLLAAPAWARSDLIGAGGWIGGLATS